MFSHFDASSLLVTDNDINDMWNDFLFYMYEVKGLMKQ